MKVDVINNKGKSVEKLELNESVFGVEPNTNLITQYVNVYRANQRQGTSSTKNRSEVRGGGKKPWKQKGTGRARAGSIRSPIWRGGGISHGPRPKSWSLSMPKKMKRAAMISTLSLKQSKNQIKILDVLEMKAPKTKDMVSLIKALKLKGKPLLVLESSNTNILKSANNIKRLKVSTIDSLNGFQLLGAGDVLFLKDAILKVQEKYKK